MFQPDDVISLHRDDALPLLSVGLEFEFIDQSVSGDWRRYKIVGCPVRRDDAAAFVKWEGDPDYIKHLIHEPPAALTTNALARKNTPVFSGCLRYFPRALAAVAALSQIGNEQHNPGTPLHWDRSKSGDELDALTRHLFEVGSRDRDGVLHDTKVAWRALANLEKVLEKLDGSPRDFDCDASTRA
jgi:hypothetical protein